MSTHSGAEGTSIERRKPTGSIPRLANYLALWMGKWCRSATFAQSEGFRGFGLRKVNVKHNKAVIRLDPREVVNFSEREKQVQSTLPKPLANRSLMVDCQVGLLLVHVKRGLWKPRSMSPHLSKQFLNAAMWVLFTRSPPSFSSS